MSRNVFCRVSTIVFGVCLSGLRFVDSGTAKSQQLSPTTEYELMWQASAKDNSTFSSGSGLVQSQGESWLYVFGEARPSPGYQQSLAGVFVEKIDKSTGLTVWHRHYPVTGLSNRPSLAVKSGNVLVVVVNTQSESPPIRYGYILLKISCTNGAELSRDKRLTAANKTALAASAIGHHGSLLVVGEKFLGGNRTVAFVEEINGTSRYNFHFGERQATTKAAALVLSSGSAYLAGSTSGNLPGLLAGSPSRQTQGMKSFVMKLVLPLHNQSVVWSSIGVDKWTGQSQATCLATQMGSEILVSGVLYREDASAPNASVPGPVVFYSTYNSSGGSAMQTYSGQYGVPVQALALSGYQATDGPYVVARESKGRFVVYKYSRTLGQVDRFVYPRPGATPHASLSAAAAALDLKFENKTGTERATGVYVVGTDQNSGGRTTFFTYKLGLVDNCHSHSCHSSHGRCVDFINSTACLCDVGYIGARCDTEVDECASNPCLNGGSCSDQTNSFSCSCLVGFSGPRCEKNIDDCQPNPCFRGNCQDGVDAFHCVCSVGWTGKLCNATIDVCLGVNCGTGTCQATQSSYQCLCPAGLTGAKCGVDMDECLSSPCRNNGTCTNRFGTFICVCPLGTTAPLCQDVCHRQPCHNGGVCHTSGHGYTCSCPVGYTGPDCQVVTSNCSHSPCFHGGVCHKTGNSVSCTCSSGWTGVRCEVAGDVIQALSPNKPLTFGVDQAEIFAAAAAQRLANTKTIPSDELTQLIAVVNHTLSLGALSKSAQVYILTAVDRLMSVDKSALNNHSSVGAVPAALEKHFGRQALKTEPVGASILHELENLALSVSKVDNNQFKGIHFTAFSATSGNRLRLKNSTVGAPWEDVSTGGYRRSGEFSLPTALLAFAEEDHSFINFIAYANDNFFNSQQSEPRLTVNSQVLSVNLSAIAHSSTLNAPVTFSLEHKTVLSDVTFHCVWWDYSEANWKTDGCSVVSSSPYSTSCTCSHLTNFAILADSSPLKHSHSETLSKISLAGGILSMIGLALTCLCILFFKKLREMLAMKITLNFSFASFMALLFFLIGAESTKTPKACQAMAVLIHFFVLSTMSWSLVVAINLYRHLIMVFGMKSTKFFLIYCLIGWGCPSTVVLLTVVAEYSGEDVYVSKNYCWFESTTWYYGTFFAEMLLIWAINTGIFFAVVNVLRKSKSVGKREVSWGKQQLKIQITIFNQLSLVWLFGFLAMATNGATETVFSYLFAIFATLQGVLVFFLNILFNRDARQALRDSLAADPGLQIGSRQAWTWSGSPSRSSSAPSLNNTWWGQRTSLRNLFHHAPPDSATASLKQNISLPQNGSLHHSHGSVHSDMAEQSGTLLRASNPGFRKVSPASNQETALFM